MAGLIVIAASAWAMAFVLAWVVMPRLRAWIEMPKHQFQDAVRTYDRLCGIRDEESES